MLTFPPRIRFLGATGTVTGSKTAVYAGPDWDDRILVDCGLFQGPKELRLRNWATLPVDPGSFSAVLITHAHIDHCGYLPRLVRNGFAGKIYCNRATADLMRILLMDAAHLQEEDARFANKMGFSKHKPALPLYTTDDALDAIRLFRPVEEGEPVRLGKRIVADFHCAGHILGASHVRLRFGEEGSEGSIVFSGDIGRYGAPILPDPENPDQPEWIVMESTYGDRNHSLTDTTSALAEVVNRSMERGGILLIPAFAVGRTQLLLYNLRLLQAEKSIERIPIFIDSPMAIRATRAHSLHPECMDDETTYLLNIGEHPIHPDNLHICRTTDESKALNKLTHNAIIISASGMGTGGRVVHHLKHRLPHPQHTILFIGYQARGTRGRTILDGHNRVKIHGQYVPIRCHIESIDGFSAHADQDELLTWLGGFDPPPGRVFINHGEHDASVTLARLIEKKYGISTELPEYLSEYILRGDV